MQAMVYSQYGPPGNLELKEVDMPAVGDDGVLVQVRAASLNWHDWHFLHGSPVMARLMAGGLLQPRHRILGSDLAGVVETAGPRAGRFRPGDEVFGSTRHGCFAGYVSVSHQEVAFKPANVTFEQAAAAGAAAFTALQGLRDAGKIEPGQRVLVNGASGGVGTFAVQLAKALGAAVTAVCSASSAPLVRSLGADRVIDYTQEDFWRESERYDLIFDVVAASSFAECEGVLAPKGIYVTTAFSPGLLLAGWRRSFGGGKKLVPLSASPPARADLGLMREMLDTGKVRPVIDRSFPLDQLADALRYLGRGHSKGKIVITM